MAGLLIASISSGQLITRTGRYKHFPILGTGIAAVGLLLLSGLEPSTGTVEAGLYMAVLGVGLGLVMQVLILAVQNAVPYSQLGVATSAATLFRSIGGSLGTAILGAIFANRLADERASGTPYNASFTDSLSTVFQLAAVVVAIAFVLAWFLQEKPLRKTIEDRDVGDAFAPPQSTDSLDELSRELGRLVGRDRTRRFIDRVVDEAGLDLSPASAWLLARSSDGTIDPALLEGRQPGDAERLREGLANLRVRGLVENDTEPARLTPAGTEVREQLLDARCRCLSSLVADWESEDPEIDALVERISAELGETAGAR